MVSHHLEDLYEEESQFYTNKISMFILKDYADIGVVGTRGTYLEGECSRLGLSYCFLLRRHLGGKAGVCRLLWLHIGFAPEPSSVG